VLDALDDRFRSPEEAAQQLDSRLLAIVPKMQLPDNSGLEALAVHAAPSGAETEAFRTLRTALGLCDREPTRMVFSSSEPGDGKTTVLANLGASYAHADKKTLLIDGDMRRPGLTKLFGLRGAEGLSDLLRNDSATLADLARTVRSAGIPGLYVLPSGPRPQDPSELLGGNQLPSLIAWAETVYDRILIDSPPIMAASDATFIGRLVDGLVLVLQPAKNRRRLVLRAAEAVRSRGVELTGVVLNRVGGLDDPSQDEDGGTCRNAYGYGGDDEGEPPAREECGPTDIPFGVLSATDENQPDERDRAVTRGRSRLRRAA
jgi:capsular exopolysaccharide synthesis family protein